MKKILLALFLLLTTFGLRAEITATFTDPSPDTELEAVPDMMYFSLSEAMNGLSPTALFKSGDKECTVSAMRNNNSYQNFMMYTDYYVSQEVKDAFAQTGEFTVTLTLNDGTVLDPVTFKMKKAAPAITATFTDPTPDTELEEVPDVMYFSLSEAMNGASPSVVMKSGDAECSPMLMRFNNSYQNFIIYSGYYATEEVKNAIAQTGEFTMTLTLNDGTVLDPVTFKMKKAAPAITATFTDPTPDTELEEIPDVMYFSLSEAMNGASPSVVMKSGDAECSPMLMRFNNSYQNFIIYSGYYATEEVKNAIAQTGEFTMTLTLNDGTVLDPVTFKMKKAAPAITATFTDPTPDTELEEVPDVMYFSLSEAMNGLSPTALFKSGDQECTVSAMRNNNSYQNFMMYVSYYVSQEVKDAIAQTGEFTVTLTLNDGTVLDPVTFKMKKAAPAITATFTDPTPDTELEEIPDVMYFSLSEAMNGLSPTALFKSGDQECTVSAMRNNNSYQNFMMYVSYYVSQEVKDAIAQTGEFTVTLTLNDGTVLDPVTFKMKKVAPAITATFDDPAGSIYAGLPDQVYFTLSEKVESASPKLLLNDEVELTCYRNNNSYENFYCFVSYYAQSILDKIMEAGEFTLRPVLADGTQLDAVKYYIVTPEISWTAAESNVPGSTYGTLPPSMTFTLSDELPADGVYTTGLLKADGMPQTFTGWDEEIPCTIEGKTVTFNLSAVSAETVAAIREAEAFTVGLALANMQLAASYKMVVRMQTVTLGYCTDEFASTFNSLGSVGAATTVGAAIKIPAAKLEALKGCEIKKIRIGFGDGLERIYGWIRPSLSEPALVMKRLDDTAGGWHEVEFDTPYVITGDEIYVGYSAYQPASVMAIRAGGADRADGCYLGVKDTWENMSFKGYGTLYIQAFTEAVLPNADLGIDNARTDKVYYKNDEDVTVDFLVFNSGSNPVKNYTISYAIDDAEPQTTTVTEAIESDGRAEHQFKISLNGIEDGVHTLTVSCAIGDEGINDEVEGNDNAVLTLPVYSQSYPRTILLENFTTIPCPNCPNGHASIENAIKDRTDIAWVAHHVGYYYDEFTLAESMAYLDFDVAGAPSMMLDRQVVKGTIPPVTIGYTNPVAGGTVIAGYIDKVAAIPALASVNIENTYDEESRKLTITVSGEKNSIFSELFPENNYTIFLTEDNLNAKEQQKGATGPYIHNHVLRAVLTPEFGTPVEWNDNTYTVTAEYTIPAEWKPWNMNVVAFLNKPFDAEDLSNCEVLNTGIVKVNAVNSVAGITADGAVQIVNGEIRVDGAYAVEVFSVDGMRLNNKGLTGGIYMIRIYDAEGHSKVIKTYIK